MTAPAAAAPPQPRAPGRPQRWPGCALGTALAVAALLLGGVALRLGVAAAAGASLHVDEAQYWDWSRTLQWGYYSKPPLIAALVAASTALFGHAEPGVRALAMACWPAAGALLAVLAHDMAGDAAQPRPERAALWAAALFGASPLVMLLGGVATTDGPLVLAWSVALLGLWLAVRRRRAGGWVLLALALALGLLGKYTMLALLPGAAWWCWRWGGPAALGRLAAAAAVAGLLLVPHLAWNAAHGWPTVQHTADITVRASSAQGGAAGLLAFAAGQLLVAGPWLAWLAAMALRGRPAQARAAAPALALLLAAAVPLLVAGAAQAWRGKAALNWTAPAQLSLVLAVALLAPRLDAARRRLWLPHATQSAALAAALLAPAVLAAALPHAQLAARLDALARLRGWPQAFQELAPHLLAAAAQEPPPSDAAAAPQPLVPPQWRKRVIVLSESRTLLAQAAYHWRGLGVERAALAAPGRPRHHYELACPWTGAVPAGAAVFLISDGPPPPQVRALWAHAELLAQVPVRRLAGAQGGVIDLWRVWPAPSPPAAPALRSCR